MWGATGVASGAGREYPGPHRVVNGRDQAIGGEQDWTAEWDKLLELPPPGIAVVSNQVRVLLEGRVVVCRQHLAVGVHVNASFAGLFEQLLKVRQIVPADKNRRIPSHADVDLGQLRVPISGRVRLVQQRHGGDTGVPGRS